MVIMRKNFIMVRFHDDSSASVNRPILFHLLGQVYFSRVFPVSAQEHEIVLSDRSRIGTASVQPYLDMLKSKGWEVAEDILVKNNVRFHINSDLPAIYETFERHVYDIDVAGSTVVDVGAGTGETSIYFLLRGAERVIGVEPDLARETIALKNLDLNRVSEKVQVRLAFVGHPTSTKLNADVLTIPQILGELIEKHPLVLKMDCEGCEFSLIESDYDSIRMFDKLVFEYHPNMVYRPLSRLLERLQDDYECKVSQGDQVIGVLKCTKKQMG